ncbi:MAG: DUF4214 domain-containing protein [Candidatus Competibacterales bacterium]
MAHLRRVFSPLPCQALGLYLVLGLGVLNPTALAQDDVFAVTSTLTIDQIRLYPPGSRVAACDLQSRDTACVDAVGMNNPSLPAFTTTWDFPRLEVDFSCRGGGEGGFSYRTAPPSYDERRGATAEASVHYHAIAGRVDVACDGAPATLALVTFPDPNSSYYEFELLLFAFDGLELAGSFGSEVAIPVVIEPQTPLRFTGTSNIDLDLSRSTPTLPAAVANPVDLGLALAAEEVPIPENFANPKEVDQVYLEVTGTGDNVAIDCAGVPYDPDVGCRLPGLLAGEALPLGVTATPLAPGNYPLRVTARGIFQGRALLEDSFNNNWVDVNLAVEAGGATFAIGDVSFFERDTVEPRCTLASFDDWCDNAVFDTDLAAPQVAGNWQVPSLALELVCQGDATNASLGYRTEARADTFATARPNANYQPLDGRLAFDCRDGQPAGTIRLDMTPDYERIVEFKLVLFDFQNIGFAGGDRAGPVDITVQLNPNPGGQGIELRLSPAVPPPATIPINTATALTLAIENLPTPTSTNMNIDQVQLQVVGQDADLAVHCGAIPYDPNQGCLLGGVDLGQVLAVDVALTPQVPRDYPLTFAVRALSQGNPIAEDSLNDNIVTVEVTATAATVIPDRDGDGIPDAVELQQGTNPDLKDNDIFNDLTLFVMQQYRDFLQREADAGGLAFWVEEMAAGRQNTLSMVEAYLLSQEFLGQVDQRFPQYQDDILAVYTVALYLGMLQRDPDQGGFEFWLDKFRNGESVQRLIESFLVSSEYYRRFLP